MKTKLTLSLILLCAVLFINCKEKEPVVEEVTVDLINDEFPEAQEAIAKTMDSIVQSIKDGDIDKLIAFHAYGPKFTEFKNGEPRNDGAANEEFERSIFGSVTEVVQMNMNDLKVDVYGDVANVTFHSDFHLMFDEDLAVVNDQISLLFVDTGKGWRIVHEHHSPLKQEEGE